MHMIFADKKRDGIQGGYLETDNVDFSFRFPTRAAEFAYLNTEYIFSVEFFKRNIPRWRLAWVGFSTLDNASIT